MEIGTTNNIFFRYIHIMHFWVLVFSSREIDHGKVALTPDQARDILPGHGRRKPVRTEPSDRPAANSGSARGVVYESESNSCF